MKEPKQCFYCGCLIADRRGLERDHFPIPERNGGIDMVDTCLACHDMKDRFKFPDWPGQWLSKVIDDMPKMSRETKIFLAKIVSVCTDMNKQFKNPKCQSCPDWIYAARVKK